MIRFSTRPTSSAGANADAGAVAAAAAAATAPVARAGLRLPLRALALAGTALGLVLGTSACENRVAIQPEDIAVSCFDADDCFEKGYAAETSPSNPDPEVADDKYARAAAYYVEACERDHGAACMSGGMIFMMAPSGVKQDQPRAVAMIEKSCTLEHPDGCSRAGDVHEDGWGVTPDAERAAEYYQEACDLGHRGACRSAKRLGS